MEIKETIITKNGEKRYCVCEKVGEIMGMAMYEEKFVGTYEECEKYISENN